MMLQFEIPDVSGEYLILGSFLLSIYIAYHSRMNGLETWRDRERFLNERLGGGSHFSESMVIEIDNVEIYEERGLSYREWKFFTGELRGNSYVGFRFINREPAPEFWETESAQNFLNALDFEVEHLETRDNANPTIGVFRIGSMNAEDIQKFATAFVEADERILLG